MSSGPSPDTLVELFGGLEIAADPGAKVRGHVDDTRGMVCACQVPFPHRVMGNYRITITGNPLIAESIPAVYSYPQVT